MRIDVSSTTKTVLGIRNISGGHWRAIAILRALRFQIWKRLPFVKKIKVDPEYKF
jgi:hypothetical protein